VLFVAILVDFKIYFNRLQGYSTVNNLIFPSLFKKCCCIGQGMKNKKFTVQWLKNQPRWPRWPHCKRVISYTYFERNWQSQG
jgi:hypothetical protein